MPNNTNMTNKSTTPTQARSKALVAGALTALLAASAVPEANAQSVILDKEISVTGQGSSFLSNFIEQCKADVKKNLGVNITYQPTGSGAGRNAYISGTNDFAASDIGFTATELPTAKAKPFVYIPVAIGGVAVIYKVPGVTELKMSAPTLAKIFTGQIQKWNDEALTKANPNITLPNEVIRVVVRSDSSGTSNVFSDYLASAGKGMWTKGATSNFPVPAGNGIAQKGSDGVSNYVGGSQGNYAITYAETSFAEERKLGVAKVINAAGNAVEPSAENVSEAMSAAAVNDDGTLLLNFNATNPKAYPISTTGYVIAPQSINTAKGDVLRTFLTYSLTGCQDNIAKAGYAPLPASLQKLGLAAVAKINPGSGEVPRVGDSSTAASVANPTTSLPPTTTTQTTAPSTTTAVTSTTKPVTKAPKKSKTTSKKRSSVPQTIAGA
jgi:phosphate transport system substrate-binding protein